MMKNKLAVKLLYLTTITLIISSVSSFGIAFTTEFQPVFGTATVDGDPEEWDLEADFFAYMYRAGDPDKPIEAKAYLRYDCNDFIVYVLVLTEDDIPALSTGWETSAWAKLIDEPGVLYDGNTVNDAVQPNFAWIDWDPADPDDTDWAKGYEASFTLIPGTYNIIIHVEVDDGGSQTGATPGFPKDGTPILLRPCPVIPELPLGTIVAVATPLAALVIYKKKTK